MHRWRRAQGLGPHARGSRAGGSKDPPLQLAERAEVRMADPAGECGTGGHRRRWPLERLVDMESREKKIRFGIFGEPRGGEAHH
jgi:hypothetical protein